MSVLLDISHIDMVFPTPKGPFTALKDVDLKINRGEFVSLVGVHVVRDTKGAQISLHIRLLTVSGHWKSPSSYCTTHCN